MIISKYIDVKISNKNLKFYNMFFPLSKSGDIVNVDVNILSKGSKQKIKVKCDVCGVEKEMCFKDYLRITKIDNKYFCLKCKNIKTSKTVQDKYNVENIFQLDEIKIKSKNTCNEKYGVDFYQQTEYFKNKVKNTNIEKYGVEFPMQSDEIKNKNTHKPTLDSINKMKSTYRINYSKIFIDKSNIIHGNKYDYSYCDYINMTTKVIIICPIHGKFNQRPKDHIHSSQGCPICKQSKGELIITNYLNSHNIEFVAQKTFKDCINIKMLPFDFYLQKFNLCVEFDGEHHFRSIEFFGGDKSFKQRKILDNIKNKYCTDNNILLLRIKYTDDIINIIDSYINKII